MEKTILAGWIIDGTGGPAQENFLVRIRNGIFVEIRPARRTTDNIPDLLDFSGCTLLPALMDAHVHLSMSGTTDENIRKQQLSVNFDSARKSISRHLAQMLSHGILGARDGGDRNGFVQRYKMECMKELYASFSLHVAGKAWHKPGRYGNFVGRALETGRLADGVLQEDGHIDHVKIIQSGLNSLKHFGKESSPQFQLDALRDAVAAATGMGLKTMVHANGRLPVEIAVIAGCHSIEHGYFMGEENLCRMAKMGVFWVPTASPMKALATHARQREGESVALRTLEHQLKQISLARRLGVSLAAGTDAGSVGVHHGSALIDEIELFCEAGFSIEEAIKCASLNGARLMGLNGKGAIREGMFADFVVVKGQPHGLPKSLGDVFKIHSDDRFL